ncbi:MAG: hypothetical protein M3Q95_10795 [Bacteroidota bacterium]|nr:hypothetical protein [Bacteroidota bacterium]
MKPSQLKFPAGIFLILLFLFPQVQKGWHDFEHRHDTHCDATAEVHFHELHHVCDLCDISVGVGFESAFGNPDIFLNTISFSFSEGAAIIAPDCYWKSLPPRAPPVSFS